MIPDMNQIIDGLLSGQYSREQALAWLDEHMKLAGDSDDLRDYFAAKAMQAMATTDMVPGEACDALVAAAAAAGQDPVYRLALNAYEVADAMLKARAA